MAKNLKLAPKVTIQKSENQIARSVLNFCFSFSSDSYGRLARRSEYEILAKNNKLRTVDDEPDETPFQKYQRLQVEVSHLVNEINDLASIEKNVSYIWAIFLGHLLLLQQFFRLDPSLFIIKFRLNIKPIISFYRKRSKIQRLLSAPTTILTWKRWPINCKASKDNWTSYNRKKAHKRSSILIMGWKKRWKLNRKTKLRRKFCTKLELHPLPRPNKLLEPPLTKA